VTNVKVDNTVPHASSVATANRATPTVGTAGQINQGDSISFTYTERMTLTSLLAGTWTSGSRSDITVTLNNGSGANSTTDTMVISNAAQHIGTIALNGNYVTTGGAPVFANSTITETVNGDGTATMRLVLTNAPSNPTNITAAVATSVVTWTPDTTVAADLAGNVLTAPPANVSTANAQQF
jgi:hypothetical protein